MKLGMTFQCIYCKTRKTLTFEEARGLTDLPFCDADGGVMPVVEAKAKRKTRAVT